MTLSQPFVATRPGSVALLTLMISLGQMSMGLYLPSMPFMAVELQAPASDVQLTLTMYLLGFTLSQFIWGPLSDRFGRRPALFTGLACFTAASIGCALADSIELLIALRFFQALGACASQVAARSIVRDTTEGADSARVMSYISMGMSVSPAITPFLGGYLQAHFGWHSNFVFLTIMGLSIAAITLVRLPETNKRLVPDALNPYPMIRNYGSLLKDQEYLGYVLVVGAIFGALLSYSTGIPFILIDQLGWSPEHFGMLLVVNVVAFLAGSLIANRVNMRVGLRKMVWIGASISAVVGLLMVFPAISGDLSTPAVMLPNMLSSSGWRSRCRTPWRER